MTDQEAYVAFNLTDKVGSVKVAELVASCGGSVVGAWDAWPSKASRAGGDVDWRDEFARARHFGVQIVTPADKDYPATLLDQPSHPLALYVKGDVAVLSTPSVAIVGTRRATAYGLDQAFKIAHGLASDGWTVVSGLALGVDAEAHRGALDAGGKTVGVIGSGLDCFYPEENRDLAREIVKKGGAVVSEFPFGRQPDQQTFPQRNHVVAALARGVVAVEAPFKSGTLITTSLAADMGRVVMAVPGRVDSRSSAGCLALLRDGARLVRSAADVEEELAELIPRQMPRSGAVAPPPTERRQKDPPRQDAPRFSIEEAIIMREIDEEGVPMDALIRRTGLPAEKVNALCVSLRLKGRVRFFPGNRVALPRGK
ncbi:MAG: DNA-processing protein DprA [Kiritimatiellae bacterium]|nr:DNA-processing protein DprA [Kiritimatiellia bacterium]